jgi:D-alanyl-D-alanine carboxypeptidase (penicillin-binding protein 5/6)
MKKGKGTSLRMGVSLIASAALCLVALAPGTARAAYETRAEAAWVYDVSTGTVLLEKNANRPLPPASMSKLMTLYMLFEALRDGRVTMRTTFPVSAQAQAMGGSTMFLNTSDRPTVEDLIRGIIVNSGNDACVVVAEGLAGSEEAFARLATDRARMLGLTETTIANASGWPDPRHRMSMRDLGILAQRLIADFPDLYPLFAEREYDYKNRSPANRLNRNPLFRPFPPEAADPEAIRADGLKTGHTEEAGFGIVASAVQGDRRVIAVYTGLPTEQARADEGGRIFNWAFRNFAKVEVARAGTRLAEAPVWLGDLPRVGLVLEQGATVLVPAGMQDAVEREIHLQGPLEAPLRRGTPVGELVVRVPDMPETRLPIVVEADVGPAGLAGRLNAALRILLVRGLALAGL